MKYLFMESLLHYVHDLLDCLVDIPVMYRSVTLRFVGILHIHGHNAAHLVSNRHITLQQSSQDISLISKNENPLSLLTIDVLNSICPSNIHDKDNRLSGGQSGINDRLAETVLIYPVLHMLHKITVGYILRKSSSVTNS